ncbi:c-type cytochrome [Altererythrobacter arenosus]|uniref:C-type cytochrome n=1 Tax=Altererythrobacter arenosus TaxID=3032592 RepID=A0ABY8FSD8_9SPHN|nr:c-type cytochrome [Altererythrobacter sp. CAU 1644]WFL76336.1 c-type cytochrome [Altererythrobacter sp. CAU 1644]
MQKKIMCLALTCLLAACGSEQSGGDDGAAPAPTAASGEDGGSADSSGAVATAADTAARPAALAQCIACHTFEEGGPDRIGPNLWDVHGKPAGSKEAFAYSTAIKESGFVWDDATLDSYLANPRQSLPGGKMSYGGMRDETARKEVIAYLATLKSDAP